MQSWPKPSPATPPATLLPAALSSPYRLLGVTRLQFGSRLSRVLLSSTLSSLPASFPLVFVVCRLMPCCLSPVACHEPTTLSTPPCSLQDPPLPLSAQLSRATTPASHFGLWNFLYTRCRLSPPDCMYLAAAFFPGGASFSLFLLLFFSSLFSHLHSPTISPSYCLAQLKTPIARSTPWTFVPEFLGHFLRAGWPFHHWQSSQVFCPARPP